MDGLTKILSKIDEDNKAAVSALLAEEEARALEEVQQIQTAAQTQVNQILTQAKASCAHIAQTGEAACEALKKQEQLDVQSEIVQEWIQAALKTITAMKAKTYFSLLRPLLIQRSQKGTGILRLNRKDCNRIPENFLEELNESLAADCHIELADTPVEINGGFILSYGDVDENCTLSALLEEHYDEIRDSLFTLLQDHIEEV